MPGGRGRESISGSDDVGAVGDVGEIVVQWWPSGGIMDGAWSDRSKRHGIKYHGDGKLIRTHQDNPSPRLCHAVWPVTTAVRHPSSIFFNLFCICNICHFC
jgi:hypothetical protein